MAKNQQQETAYEHIRELLRTNSELNEAAVDHFMRKSEIEEHELIEFIMGYNDIDSDTDKETVKNKLEERYTG